MIPAFCSPSFMNRSEDTLHDEEVRVTELQATIHKKIDELIPIKFAQIEFTFQGKEITKIPVPSDIKTFVEAYSIIKKLSHTLTDARLRELIRLFYDCEFCLSIKPDYYDCYELKSLFNGVHHYNISIDGYSDEIVELVSFFNENVLKTEKQDTLDFDSLEGL